MEKKKRIEICVVKILFEFFRIEKLISIKFFCKFHIDENHIKNLVSIKNQLFTRHRNVAIFEIIFEIASTTT